LQITSEQPPDTNGGDVVVEINGKAAGLCPDGTESLRFRWRFANDITTIHSGSMINVALEAGQVRSTGSCGTSMADRSSFAVTGSSGVGSGFPDSETRFLEVERIYTKQDGVFGHFQTNHTSSAILGVSTEPWPHGAPPDAKLAFFQVIIITPTAEGGGILRYTYIYEKGAKAPGGGSCNLSGRWNVTHDEVFSFAQNGGQVTGSGVTDPTWHFSGTILGTVVTGQWSTSKESGRLILILNPDCNSFSSAWGLGDNYNTWSASGQRIR
jgi:hypothetical protein